nr:NADH dehydrogenase subunit 2 [Gonostoma atlanticum]
MHPLTSTYLLITLGLGTTLTISGSHWLLAWMGLEINTLAILPIMTQKHHPRTVEATTKYFLIQATATTTMLFASLSNAWLSGEWTTSQPSHHFPVAMMIMALALKTGLAPVHLWLPETLQGLNLTTGLILSTWQKLAPFALIIQTTPSTSPHLLTGLGLTSILIGGWGGLNQTQLRKVIAYSSIAHLGWTIIVVQLAPSIAMLGLLLYILMTSTMFLSLDTYNCTNLNSLATSWTKTPTLGATLCLTLLSLGGLPPLSGFMSKWLILAEMTKQELQLPATAAALSALLSLYFYLRLSYTITLTSPPNTSIKTTPWRLTPLPVLPPLATLSTLAIGILPLTPTTLAWLN